MGRGREGGERRIAKIFAERKEEKRVLKAIFYMEHMVLMYKQDVP